jgi:hypothetical protein
MASAQTTSSRSWFREVFAGRKLEGEKECSGGGKTGEKRRWLGFSGDGLLGGEKSRAHTRCSLPCTKEEDSYRKVLAGRRK